MSGSAFAVTHHAFSSGAGRTSDGNGSHASTLKSPSYTKSVSWQHYRGYKPPDRKEYRHHVPERVFRYNRGWHLVQKRGYACSYQNLTLWAENPAGSHHPYLHSECVPVRWHCQKTATVHGLLPEHSGAYIKRFGWALTNVIKEPGGQ
ncbi:putative alpha-mannosidase [Shigella flexneri 2002017]|nr:putative alpha-mannosidase [Shigella flexneri 2002017]